MKKFDHFRDLAEKRKGGPEAIAALLAEHGTPDHARLAALGDDRILSQFSRLVFSAGFNWSVIEKKWPGFEDAFWGFDPARCAFMNDEDFDALLSNTAIVRHAAKILSVRDNAIFLCDLAKEHGSAAKFFAEWPADNQVGLWEVMKKRGARLGGNTGQYALRFLGRDSFILSNSVVTALKSANVIDGPATSKKAHVAIQDAFNSWHAETGESYTYMSRILAMSVDD